MLLIISTLLALLEGSRFYEIKRLSQIQSQVALESVFAEYSTPLWEQYRLLGCAKENLVGGLEKYGNRSLSEEAFGTNFYQFSVKEAELKSYTRLTDGDGRGFIQAVSSYMKENLWYESAKEIYNQYEGIKEMQEDSRFDLKDIDRALKKLEEKNSSAGSSGKKTEEIEQTKEIVSAKSKSKKHVLEIFRDLQKKGVLSLVLEDSNSLADKEINITNAVSKRQLPDTCALDIKEPDWYDRILLQQYLLTYMSCYTEEKEHFAKYELEYLIGGKSSEIDNLKTVVNQLLGIRETANFLYLTKNAETMEEARLMALAIVGGTLNPALIEMVKMAILAAWAFAESILDLRTLLTGGKIALIKSGGSWTSNLKNIENITQGYAKAKNCKNGLNYTEYVGILLFLQNENLLSKRAMDMQELTIRKEYNDESFYMEDLIIKTQVCLRYSYRPVFFSINKIVPNWNYEIKVYKEYEY